MEIICSICCCGFLDQKQQETQFPLTRSPSGSNSGSNTVYASYCGHVFHKSCIIKWIERAPSCPECRSVLRSKSDFNKLYFNVNPKWCSDPDLEQSPQPCDADEEKIFIQKRNEKLTKYIKSLTKSLGHVELKVEKLAERIAKKEQEIAELKSLISIDRLITSMKRQSIN